MKPFIDPEEIRQILYNTTPSPERIHEIIAKSLSKQRLNLEEAASLLNADSPDKNAVANQECSEDLKTATKAPMHQISPSLNYSFGIVWCFGVLVAKKCL